MMRTSARTRAQTARDRAQTGHQEDKITAQLIYLHMLPSELLVLIVKAVLLSTVPQRDGKCTPLRVLATVSTSFAAACSTLANSGAVHVGVTPDQLRAFKRAAHALDLSSLREPFLRTVEAQLGNFEYRKFSDYDLPDEDEEGDPMIGNTWMGMITAWKRLNAEKGEVVDDTRSFAESQADATHALFKSVAESYKKMLVIKAVEMRAAETKSVAQDAEQFRWLERSMCTKVIDCLWHTHLLSPQHYLTSCSSVLGYVGVIDHDRGYVSKHEHKGSSLAHKIANLYEWERLPDNPYFAHLTLQASLHKKYGLSLHDDVQSWLLAKQPEDWLEYAFQEVESGDEMECGCAACSLGL